jgi:hypothetical protein
MVKSIGLRGIRIGFSGVFFFLFTWDADGVVDDDGEI